MKISTGKVSYFLKSEAAWISVIFIVGFFLRIIYFQQNQQNPLYIASTSMIETPPNWFSPSALWRSPLFLYFTRGIFNIFVHSYFMLKMTFFAMGSASLVLIYMLAKKIFNPAIARIASFIALIYAPFIFYEGELSDPALAIPLGLIFFLLVLNAFEKPSKRRWFICGIFWALAMLARHHFSIFGFAVMVYLARDFFKNGFNKKIIAYILCMFLGFAMTISPITLRNILVGKDFVLIGYVEGVSFWHGNNPDYVKLRDRAHGFGWDQIQQLPFIEAQKMNRQLKPSDISRYFFNKSLEFIKNHPIQWLKLTAMKTGIFLSGYETMGDSDIYSYRQYSPLLKMLVGNGWILYPFGVVCPLAIAGMILLTRNSRKASLLTVMIISVSFMDILLAVQSRYRISAVPFFIIAAAYAPWRWYIDRMNVMQKKTTLISIVFFVTLLFLCNIYNPEMSAVGKARVYFKKAEGYLIMKNNASAIAEIKKAIEAYPDNPSSMLHIKLANLYIKQGDVDKAAAEYESAIRIEPQNSMSYVELARILEEKGRLDEAAAEYKKSLTLPMMPDYQVTAHFNLGIIYKKKMSYNDAAKEFQFVISHRELIKDFRLISSACINLGEIYETSGQTDNAIAVYEQALKIDPENSLIKNKIEILRHGKTN